MADCTVILLLYSNFCLLTTTNLCLTLPSLFIKKSYYKTDTMNYKTVHTDLSTCAPFPLFSESRPPLQAINIIMHIADIVFPAANLREASQNGLFAMSVQNVYIISFRKHSEIGLTFKQSLEIVPFGIFSLCWAALKLQAHNLSAIRMR